MDYIKKLYSGRISRKNYGLGLLFFLATLILFAALLVGSLASESTFLIIVMVVVYIAFIVHIFSLHVRRLHDVGYSGWWCIPPLTPYVMIALLFMKSRDNNKYGDIPSKNIKFFDAIFNRNQPVSVVVDDQIKEKNSQYCVKCGAQVEASSKFCYKCGTKVIAPNK